MSYIETPDERDVRRERERRIAALQERADWVQLYRIYERCVGIAEKIWNEKLETAAAQQQALAEAMRDRYRLVPDGNPEMFAPKRQGVEIPVPLFTPRDRLQFVKEVGATLLISADRRQLTALYREPNGEAQPAQTENAAPQSDTLEAASGTDEAESVAPLALVPEADEEQRISETPQPSL